MAYYDLAVFQSLLHLYPLILEPLTDKQGIWGCDPSYPLF